MDVLLLRYHRKQKDCTWTIRKGKFLQLSQELLQSGTQRTKARRPLKDGKGLGSCRKIQSHEKGG